MMFKCLWYVLILVSWNLSSSSSAQWPPALPISTIPKGKGSTDNKPIFISGNYIPATMQVLFHLSDSMKYDLKPSGSVPPSGIGGTTVGSPGGGSISPGSTSTTVRPTPPHKPGNYAPERPQGPAGFYSFTSETGWTFGWGRKVESNYEPEPVVVQNDEPSSLLSDNLPEDIELFGAGPAELLRQINTLEDEDTIGEEDADIGQIAKFSVNYEDNVNLDYLRQKKVPPTRAYVTVLSLYDLLNKESKELGLNKFNGYGDNILKELIKTSSGTSSEQLHFVLSKIVNNKNTKKDNILKKIKAMINDLEKEDSYINMAIKYVPALQFSLAKCT